MVLMIDNYDSFTYNIVQYCRDLKVNVKLIKNDDLTLNEVIKLEPSKILLSPGPSSPDNSGICIEVVNYFKDKIPIFGICLGHQIIAQVFGAKIIKAEHILHGKSSDIKVIQTSTIFESLPKKFMQTRYNSLIVDKVSLNDNIIVTSLSENDEIMSLEIKNRKIYGVQFHPESINSKYGHEILWNFLKL